MLNAVQAYESYDAYKEAQASHANNRGAKYKANFYGFMKDDEYDAASKAPDAMTQVLKRLDAMEMHFNLELDDYKCNEAIEYMDKIKSATCFSIYIRLKFNAVTSNLQPIPPIVPLRALLL